MSTLLGMFAKYWEPGRVKTRLAAAIGNERAALIHRALVETLAARFRSAAERRILCYSPSDAAAGFTKLAADTWELAPQTDGDLGVRMQAFFEAALEQAERVVLIGSDSPDLPAEYVASAFEALRTRDVVLGPAADGGYYLVGAARRVPPIFDDIDWSTAAVWTQTVECLQAAQIVWHELPGWYDVDDEPSLQLLLRNLHVERNGNPQLLRLRERLQALLNDWRTV